MAKAPAGASDREESFYYDSTDHHNNSTDQQENKTKYDESIMSSPDTNGLDGLCMGKRSSQDPPYLMTLISDVD